MTTGASPYVELHCHSAYSFLDGASHPEELVARAAELGYEALALTDHDGVYGSLEFAHAAKFAGIRPITGAEVTVAGGSHVTLLVEDGEGYANLCRILTAAHAGTRPPGKEHRVLLDPSVSLETLAELSGGLVCLSGCARDGLALRDPQGAARLAAAFGRERFFVELQRPYERGDARRHTALRDLAERAALLAEHERVRSLLVSSLTEAKPIIEVGGSMAKGTLVRAGYDPVYGARPLKRLIQQGVETPMARQLVKGELRDGDSAVIDVKDDRIVVVPVVESTP